MTRTLEFTYRSDNYTFVLYGPEYASKLFITIATSLPHTQHCTWETTLSNALKPEGSDSNTDTHISPSMLFQIFQQNHESKEKNSGRQPNNLTIQYPSNDMNATIHIRLSISDSLGLGNTITYDIPLKTSTPDIIITHLHETVHRLRERVSQQNQELINAKDMIAQLQKEYTDLERDASRQIETLYDACLKYKENFEKLADHVLYKDSDIYGHYDKYRRGLYKYMNSYGYY